jgi:hypothetical protein
MSAISAVLDELREAVFAAYRVLREHGTEGHGRTELERRESALLAINNILEQRPLGTFTAEHLEFLETLIAYWRELEVDAGVPEPEHVHLLGQSLAA